MKLPLALTLLFLALAEAALGQTCPRIWRGGDTLYTDPAPALQWLRDDTPIPGATGTWLRPEEAGSYSVEAFGEASLTFPACRSMTQQELEEAPFFNSLPEALAAGSAVHKANLSNGRFAGEWDALARLQCLRWIWLTNNELTELSETIDTLAKLERLVVGGNLLTRLPESLCKLEGLQWLDANRNQLTELPDSIGSLRRLQRLWLLGNPIAKLPDSFGELESLQWADLSDNQLAALPESIGRLKNLEELYLNDNPLTALPESVSGLTGLKRLWMANTQLTDLPESIASLADTLELINLIGNPIPEERRAAIQALLPRTTIMW